MLSATSILLAFWLAVVLLCDIDGFKRARERRARDEESRSGEGNDASSREPPDQARPR